MVLAAVAQIVGYVDASPIALVLELAVKHTSFAHSLFVPVEYLAVMPSIVEPLASGNVVGLVVAAELGVDQLLAAEV